MKKSCTKNFAHHLFLHKHISKICVCATSFQVCSIGAYLKRGVWCAFTNLCIYANLYLCSYNFFTIFVVEAVHKTPNGLTLINLSEVGNNDRLLIGIYSSK